MTRRELFRRVLGLAAGAAVAPHLPVSAEPVWSQRMSAYAALHFKDVPVVTSSLCPSNTIYFLSREGLLCDNPRRLGVITDIS